MAAQIAVLQRQTAAGAEATPRARRTPLARLVGDPMTVTALLMLGLLCALALAADVLAERVFRFGFSQQDLQHPFQPPQLGQPALWLGSDEIGRSQVVRLLYGARVSLGVGVGATLVNLTGGLALGLVAGYFRGWVDDLAQWFVATLESVPRLFVLLLFSTFFEPGPAALVGVIGLLSWPRIAQFVRGQVLTLRRREFIIAAHTLGASDGRLLLRHVLPNVLPLALVLASMDVGIVVLTESALSYLGLGIQPPLPSWGNMLTAAADLLYRGPWLVYAPGTAIFITVLCTYVAGDGLRDALDPHLAHK